MSEGHRRTEEQEKGPTGAEGLLGQDRRLDGLAGSRAPGIGLGCPLGLGGSGFCRRLGGCGVTSQLGYAAGDARLRGEGVGTGQTLAPCGSPQALRGSGAAPADPCWEHRWPGSVQAHGCLALGGQPLGKLQLLQGWKL